MTVYERLGETCRKLHERAFTILCHLRILAFGLGMGDVFTDTGIPTHEIKLQETYAILVREVTLVTHPDDKVLELGVLVIIKPGVEFHDLRSVLIRLERLAQSIALCSRHLIVLADE